MTRQGSQKYEKVCEADSTPRDDGIELLIHVLDGQFRN